MRRAGRAAGGPPDLLSQVEAATDLLEGSVFVGATRPVYGAARVQEGNSLYEYTGELCSACRNCPVLLNIDYVGAPARSNLLSWTKC